MTLDTPVRNSATSSRRDSAPWSTHYDFAPDPSLHSLEDPVDMSQSESDWHAVQHGLTSADQGHAGSNRSSLTIDRLRPNSLDLHDGYVTVSEPERNSHYETTFDILEDPMFQSTDVDVEYDLADYHAESLPQKPMLHDFTHALQQWYARARCDSARPPALMPLRPGPKAGIRKPSCALTPCASTT